MQQYLIAKGHNENVERWKIIYNNKKKIHDLQKQDTLISHETAEYPKSWTFLVDEKSNKLLSSATINEYNSELIIQDLDNKSVKSILFENRIVCMTWHYSKTHQRRFLILGFLNGQIEVWDLKVPHLFKRLEDKDFKCFKIKFLVSNEGAEELMYASANEGWIGCWCMKTFTLKRCYWKRNEDLFERDGYVGNICFLNKTMFVATSSTQYKTKIWGANTEYDLFEETNRKWCNNENPIYSMSRQLLVTMDSSGSVLRVWKVIFKPYVDMVLECIIKNPYEERFSSMVFLDPEEQTQLLVSDWSGNFFLLDLTLEKFVWEKHCGEKGAASLLVYIKKE